jgi:hypothetical protein
MDNNLRKQWERFLTPEILRSNLIMASLYIVVFERLKNAIIERIYDFYTTGFDEDGDIVDPDYETKVLSRNSSPVYASLDWLLENNAISSHDIDLFDQIKKLRNSIAHEIDKMMIDGLPTELPESFNDMANLLDKIENWWIVNVEIPTDPDFARGDIEKDEDRIIPGSIASLKMMVDIALGTDEEAEYYINEFRRLGLLGPNPGSS